MNECVCYGTPFLVLLQRLDDAPSVKPLAKPGGLRHKSAIDTWAGRLAAGSPIGCHTQKLLQLSTVGRRVCEEQLNRP